MKTHVTLLAMKEGEAGVVIQVAGGRGLNQRLGAMGIRPGAVLRKISRSLMRGPVIVQIGNARVALGFGMAAKVLVAVGTPSRGMAS
jgi:ferrous iron transport protein A